MINLTQPRKLVTLELTLFLNLALRSDDYIKLEDHNLGLVIRELDKNEYLVHVEEPNDTNKLSCTQLWRKKAWKEHELYRTKLVEQSKYDNMLFDNMKFNREIIARKLRDLTGIRDTSMLNQMAIDLLKNNPDNLDSIGVELKHPYYRGVYDVLPFRERSGDDNYTRMD